VIKKSDSGFSIIEMVIAVAVAAILGSIAIPQIQESLDAYRLNASARIVASELNAGRVLAISRNWTYRASAPTAPAGIQIVDPADANNNPRSLKFLEPGISISTGAAINFLSRGQSNGGTVTLTNTNLATIVVTVNAGGKVIIGDFTP